jgi:carbon monoxide dehydrogenase subunit G
MTTKVDKSIQVDQPVNVVYNQWTQFEEFPNFMGGVQSVTQLDDRRLHWVAEIAGVKREWDATILEQVPDEKIAWAATEGATNAGAVYFAPSGAGRTEVRLSLEYAAEGIIEKIGDKLHIIEKQAESDLERFKTFIEERRSPTGAWRGDVAGATTTGTPGVEDAAASQGTSGKAGLSTAAKVAGAAVAAAGVAAAGAMRSKSDEADTASADVAPETFETGAPVMEIDEVAVIESDLVVDDVDLRGDGNDIGDPLL